MKILYVDKKKHTVIPKKLCFTSVIYIAILKNIYFKYSTRLLTRFSKFFLLRVSRHEATRIKINKDTRGSRISTSISFHPKNDERFHPKGYMLYIHSLILLFPSLRD